MPPVIRTNVSKRLDDALARAVAVDPGLASARALLLHPLRLLDALGRDAGHVLQDDVFAIERTRLLLSQAALSVRELFAAITGSSRISELLDSDASEDAAENNLAGPNAVGRDPQDLEPADQRPRSRLCHDGLIDLSALVIVGLAATRVGRRLARQNIATGFAMTVEALAIAALPAESLAQALDDGLDDEQLVAVLGAVRGSSSAELVALAPLFLDRVEQARFAAIKYLFVHIRADADEQWDSTFDRELQAVERRADGQLRVWLDAGSNDSTNALLDALEGERASSKFVFVTDQGEVIERPASSISKAHNFADVQLPARALSGWLGIASKDSKATARADRTRIRKKWIALDNHPPLRAHSVDVKLIAVPKAGRALPPPRSPAACWGVEIVALELLQGQSTTLAEHTSTSLIVRLARSIERGRIEYELGVSPTQSTDVSGDRATITLDPEWISAGAELRVRLFVGDSQVPDHEHSTTISIAAVATVRRVVVASFTFLDNSGITRVSSERAAALMLAAARTDPRLQCTALPWMADGDLLTRADPTDRTQAAGEALLGQLAALAGRTIGLEGAAFVALIPGDGKYSLWQPADAAQAVGVATPAAFSELLRSIELGTPGTSRRRLRIVGELTSNRISIDQPIRTCERPVGPGAPHPSPYVAVLYDGKSIELGRHRIHTHGVSGFGSFVALLELPEATTRVELRVDDEKVEVAAALASRSTRNLGALLGRSIGLPSTGVIKPAAAARLVIERPQGTAAIKLRKFEQAKLEWRYFHTHGVPAVIDIEVGRAGMWSRLERLTSKTDSFTLELDERPIGPAPTHVRIVASDGWNTVMSEPLELGELGDGKALLIRSAGVNRYYVEGSVTTSTLRWTSGDDESFEVSMATNALLQLPTRIRVASLIVEPRANT